MSLPETQHSDVEKYLGVIVGQPGVVKPPVPHSDVERYLDYICENGGGGGGTTNYNALNNKPSINGHTLEGNKTTQELDILASGSEAYDNYQTAVEDINDWEADHRGVGDNIYIRTKNVPDLWISSVEETSVPYTYTTDAAIVNALNTTGYVQVGYYKLSALETEKPEIPVIQVDGNTVEPVGGIVNIKMKTSDNYMSFNCAMADGTTKTLKLFGELV